MTAQYLPFDLEAALKDQRDGKPCRIVRRSDGVRAVDFKYWEHGDSYGGGTITIQINKLTISHYCMAEAESMFGLMPERVEWYVYSWLDFAGGINRSTMHPGEKPSIKKYRITENIDGSEPEIEIIK